MQKQRANHFPGKATPSGEPWRITYIPYGEELKPVFNPGAVLGALLFVSSIFLWLDFSRHQKSVPVVLGQPLNPASILTVSVVGLLLALASLWRTGRQQRKNWIKVQAQCRDREWKHVCWNGEYTWAFRVLCAFQLKGQTYEVTPSFWTGFPTEKAVMTFLDRHIAVDGRCELWVNPQNPFQAELVGHDVKDFLLH